MVAIAEIIPTRVKTAASPDLGLTTITTGPRSVGVEAILTTSNGLHLALGVAEVNTALIICTVMGHRPLRATIHL